MSESSPGGTVSWNPPSNDVNVSPPPAIETFAARTGFPARSTTVSARDGYDGRPHAVTHFGSVRVKPTRQPIRVRVVLSESMSI